MSKATSQHASVSEAVDRNISAIHDLRVDSDERRRTDQKFIDAVAAFLGSPSSLYVHLIFYGAWFWVDIPAASLSTVASVEAIFLALFVLINQRRMNTISRRHSDLHLQMTLLTEHEMTRIARATDAMSKHLGVSEQTGDNLDEVKQDIHPHEILDRISDQEEKAPTALTNDQSNQRKPSGNGSDQI